MINDKTCYFFDLQFKELATICNSRSWHRFAIQGAGINLQFKELASVCNSRSWHQLAIQGGGINLQFKELALIGNSRSWTENGAYTGCISLTNISDFAKTKPPQIHQHIKSM